MTTDPSPAAKVAKSFASLPSAQKPSDLRIAGLMELVSVIHEFTKETMPSVFSVKRLHFSQLKRFNFELDAWEA